MGDRLWDQNSRHGIHWCVLDSGMPDPGAWGDSIHIRIRSSGRPVRFCWYRILWSVVSKRSTAAASAAFNKSPLFSLSQPLALAVMMVWVGQRTGKALRRSVVKENEHRRARNPASELMPLGSAPQN